MNKYNWVRFGEFEHITLMADNEIQVSDLSDEIQNEIIEFNMFFSETLRDGFVSENEQEDLLNHSERIAKHIRKEYEQKESSGSALGVLAIVGLMVGAAFGVNHVMNK
jgi:hypothetical protein